MTGAQHATYQMIHGVKEHGDANPQAWTDSVPFTNGFNFFKTRLAALDAVVPKQLSPAGVRSLKRQKRDDLRAGVTDLVTGLRSFGYDSGRQEVLDIAKYTPSDIVRMTLDDLSAVAESLHANTVDILNPALPGNPAPDLSPYGITPASLAILSGHTGDFNKLKGQEKAARAVPVDATARIAAALTELVGILDNRLDNAAVLLRKAQPEFVAQYFVVRRIDDAHHSVLALTVHVQDAAGAAISKAAVSFSTGIRRRTSEKGNSQVQHLPEGRHTITVTKGGYTPVSQEATIVSGETKALIITLQTGRNNQGTGDGEANPPVTG